MNVFKPAHCFSAESIELPYDRVERVAAAYVPAQQEYLLDTQLQEKVAQFAQANHIPLKSIYLSGFVVQIARYANSIFSLAVRGEAVELLHLKASIASEISFVEVVEQVDGKTAVAEEQSCCRIGFGWGRSANQALAELNTLDLYLVLDERTCVWSYNSTVFESCSIERIAQHFQTVLASALDRPTHPIGDLDLLPEAEQTLLFEWGKGDSSTALESCVHRQFEAQAGQNPEAVAVEWGDRRLTYGELNRQANQLAHYLRSLGVTAETLVGLCIERSPEALVGLFGILKAGGAYLPLDPLYPQERLAYMLEDAKSAIVVTQSHLRDRLPNFLGQLVCLDDLELSKHKWPDGNLTHPVNLSDLAYVIYTSGSTGQPKGVAVEQRALANFTQAARQQYEISSRDRMLQFASLSFDAAAEEIFPCLTAGGTLVLKTPAMQSSVTEFLAASRDQQLTVWLLPTAYWELLASELTVSPQPELLPPTLRLVVYGGEQCNARQVQLWQERFGGYPKLIDSYGPTETTVVATAFAVSDRWDADSQPRTPIGKPIAGVETFVLDSRHKLLPIGIPGELYIGGRGVARGYLNRPELTAERFIPHPLSTDPKARLYRTGDCVRVLPDGNLDYLGRWDRQVKVAGHRIEVGEVEAAIAAHPKVAAVAVTMHQREGMGACLVAYIVEHKDGTCRNLTEIRTFLASKLPQYAIPAGFVSIDALPTTLNGKIDLKQLPPPRWDGQEREIEPPQTQTEETLKDIWCELFQLQHLGRNDNFFELGGSSLLAIRLVTQIERAFAVVLPIAAVVSHPTLAQLAIAIDSGWQADPLEARVGGLAAEVYLDGAIVNAAMGNRLDTDPRNAVFLTGGTGFFGPHLLSEILRQTPATVYCAIRSPKLAMGQDKLISGLKQHHLWREEYASRIVPVAADLSQPFLGLAEAKFNALADIVSAVYHNAAWVNFVYPYSTLKATNVSGTQNILKLAGINRIPVHYVSSMSAFEADPRNFLLESDSPIWEESLLGGGYGASKWVAEKSLELARSQGLPISIYRLGTLVGGSFYQNNFFSCFLKSCLELAAVPSVDGSLNLMAAELVARGLVGLSLEESCSTFHLTHPQSISWLDMVQWFNDFGYGLTPYPFEEWIRRLLRNRGNSLEPFLSILKTAEDLPLDRQTFCTAFTEKRLQAIGMEFPKLGRSTIERYLTDFQEGTRQDRVLVSV